MEFLGNKTSLLPDILTVVRDIADPGAQVADLFSGTGTVSSALADSGYIVHANDQLPLAAMWAHSQLRVTARLPFSAVPGGSDQSSHDGYAHAIDYLNQLPPETGWVTKNYTPLSARYTPYTRMYFSEDNGRRIDAIRNQINRWGSLLNRTERALLMASLVDAASRVSNIAGTYGCYLKGWKPRALNPLDLHTIPTVLRNDVNIVTCDDAQIVAEKSDASVIYADPPYTKRQYAAYYHLLNSLIQSEDPEIKGKTGLPLWQRWSSDWCYVRRAPGALERLAAKSAAPRLVLSYSSDGHIPHEAIISILGRYGSVEYQEIERRRYKSSAREHRASSVMERIYVMSR